MKSLKDILAFFVFLLFALAIAMIVSGIILGDNLFYIRAGIFGVAGLFLGWKKGMVARIIFRPHDFWIGFYLDRKRKILYFFPIPMFGLRVSL